MKTRLSLVSNSSTSSFICDVCGAVESGQDACLSDVGMIRCENGHDFQKKGYAEVSPGKLKDRFLKLYHLQEPLAGVKDALARLAPQHTADFCKWLSQLQGE